MKENVKAPVTSYDAALKSRLKAAAGSGHLDPEQLAAFVEQALSKAERDQVMRHLSVCAECRDVAYTASNENLPAPEAAHAAGSRAWRWAWTAALAGATFSLVFLVHRDRARPPEEEEIRPVTAHVQPKPFVEPEPSSAPATRVRRSIAPLPEPPALSPRSVPVPLPLLALRVSPEPARLTSVRGMMRVEPVSKPFVELKPSAAPINRTRISISPLPEPPSLVRRRVPVPSPVLAVRLNAEPLRVAFAGGMMRTESVGKVVSETAFLASAGIASLTMKNWTIDNRGQLQKPTREGMQQISLNGTDPFTAVGSLGQEVWAGRADASLYHSTDGGKSWNRVYIESSQGVPMAPISSIRVVSPFFVEVGTRNGERWITSNAGREWKKN